MNFIAKMENLDKDMEVILKKISLPETSVPQKNKSSHRQYASFYDSHLVKIVEKAFEKDIELLKYRFNEENTSPI